MVDDESGDLASPNGIGAVVDIFFLSSSHADKADDVVGIGEKGVIPQRDAGIGRGLPEDGGVCAYSEVRRQGDDAAHVEYHNLLAVAADSCS